MNKENNTILEGFSYFDLPERNAKPRQSGINVLVDRGIPLKTLENALSYHKHIDVLEIGPEALISNDLQKRVSLCKKLNITPFLSGIVFEAFLKRDKFDGYMELCEKNQIDTFMVSDGCVTIHPSEKCSYIEKLARIGTVYSKVGSKDPAYIIPPYKWIELMRSELECGSKYVFAESKDAGNVGIYRGSGEVREGLVQEIITQILPEQIVWGAPQKLQQVYFIQLLGTNCNLSNISPERILEVEALRLGLHEETFSLFTPEKEID